MLELYLEEARRDMRQQVPSLTDEQMDRLFRDDMPSMLTISLSRPVGMRYEAPDLPPPPPPTPYERARQTAASHPRLSLGDRKRLAKRKKTKQGRKAHLRNRQRH